MKKNILLFVTDEHRLSGIGAYGKTPCKTPNIDRLAEQGVLFENTYTTCPLCSPARASLLTGLHIHSHGLTANEGEMGCGNARIPDSPNLLGRKLEANGYNCGYNGKWHISGVINPTDCGFVGYNYPGHGSGGHYYGDYKKYVQALGYEWKIKPHKTDGEKITGFGITDFPEEATVSHYLANNTIEMIDELSEKEKPFFIWHNDWGPHGEHWVPQEYYDMYKDVEIPKWGNFDWKSENPYFPVTLMKAVPNNEQFTWDDYAEVIRHYYAFCTLIDDQVGRIVNHLEEKGLLEDTVIIFTSDHGETLGSHGGLTDKGWSHFEEIQRIPLIVSDPDGNKEKVVSEFASLIDVYATICDYADANYSNSQGHSLLQFIEKEPQKVTRWRDCVFVEFFGLGGCATNMVTCRKENLKYGWTCSNKDELYDLSKDPDELHNLIEDPAYAEDIEYLRKCMYTFMVESEYPATYTFLRYVLGWNIDRQYLNSQDPIDIKKFLVDIVW